MQRIAPLILNPILAALLFGVFGLQALAQESLTVPDAQTPVLVPPPPGFASVNIAHFAPFADDPAGTSVTVAVNGIDTFTDVVYFEHRHRRQSARRRLHGGSASHRCGERCHIRRLYAAQRRGGFASGHRRRFGRSAAQARTDHQ